MRSARLVYFACIGAAAIAGCDSFGSGTTTTPEAEAGVLEASTVEPLDAAEEKPEAATDAGPFCVDQELCLDFDSPTRGDWAKAGNDAVKTSDGAVTETVSGDAGMLLRSSLPSGNTNAVAIHRLVRDGLDDLRISMDLFIEPLEQTLGADNIQFLLTTFYGEGPTDPSASLALRGTGSATAAELYLYCQNVMVAGARTNKSFTGSLIVPYGQWLHVTLGAALTTAGTGGGGARVKVEATGVPDAPAVASGIMRAAVPSGSTKTVVFLGAQRFSSSTPSPLTVRVDNVAGSTNP